MNTRYRKVVKHNLNLYSIPLKDKKKLCPHYVGKFKNRTFSVYAQKQQYSIIQIHHLIFWDFSGTVYFHIKGGHVSQQVWHIKKPALLKAISAKHRSKFAALSPVMVTAAK
jgi:hypothetical protein